MRGSQMVSGRLAGFRRVLVGSDLSAGSEEAALRAARIPMAPGARITLIHVMAPDISFAVRQFAEKKALGELGRIGRRLARVSSARVAARIVTAAPGSRPYAEIIRQARSMKADLIVVGRHGRRQLVDMLIGSTAESVIRHGEVPVLVVSNGRRSYQRPVVAVSLEDGSRAVVAAARRALGPAARRATILHSYVVPFEGLSITFLAPEEIRIYRNQRLRLARDRMERLKKSIARLEISRSAVVSGDPRKSILRECVRRRADLLVVGSHAQLGASESLLGNVAESLVRRARCDVMVARLPEIFYRPP